MKETYFSFSASSGVEVFTYRWEPEEAASVKGAVLIIHGISEHAGRYRDFAQALTEAGFLVYAPDLPGHGKTSQNQETFGHAGDNGWNALVHNVYELTERINGENADLPLFIMGHSMGSFILRSYMYEYGDSQRVQGFILSGTGGSPWVMLTFGRLLCTLMMKVKGKMHKSPFIQGLTFKDFNAKCRENLTCYDWLTRDTQIVDSYIKDELCGQVCTVSFYRDFFQGILDVQQQANISRIPKHVPVLIFSGQMDPVGGYGKTVLSLVQRYQAAGIQDVTWKLYENGRHEMLNEVNRNEVMQDIIRWIDLKVS